jgi:group I intron endonuclease
MESDKTYYYIYEITNLINRKTYIGQHTTKNLNDGYMGSGSSLLKALKKYGKDNFKKEILLFAVNQVALNFFEKCLVTEEFINQQDNYNLREGGGCKGKLSVENILKLKGQKRTEETKRKMSLAHKGKKLSEEHKRKIGLNSKHAKKFLGKKHTEESKRKIGLAGIGRKKAPDSVAKIVAFHTGRKRSPETGVKISQKKSKPRPALINTLTMEIVPAGFGCSNFCRERDLEITQFCSMIKGRRKQYKGWQVYVG